MTVLPKPRAVIYDWDDTLVDTWQVALQARNTALVAMGQKAWSDEEARVRAGASGRDLFRQLFGDRGPEAEKIYYEAYNNIVLDKMRVFDGVKEILELFKSVSVPQVVVSNKRGLMLRKESEHLGLIKYFAKVVGAGDAVVDKPDAAPVFLALEGSGVQAGADVWFIGDSHLDMLCAKNAGCTSILIETKPPPEELLFKYPPAKRVANHRELMEFLNGYFT